MSVPYLYVCSVVYNRLDHESTEKESNSYLLGCPIKHGHIFALIVAVSRYKIE